MRAGTVQIVWHDTKPVLTLDFHPTSGTLATGGADKEIKIWQVVSGDPQKKLPSVTYTNFLSYHSSPVNALRFSPSGEFLASGADGGELILWKLHTTDEAQTWKVHKTLAFHCKDILDLQWSSDGGFLISGSVDNSCIIWDVNKGSVHQILDAHLHYVQGVAWDPLGKYVASLSSDRTCRIYINKPEKKIKGKDKLNFVSQHVISKAEQQATTDDAKVLKNHLFLDETLPSFFRRMAWSPDGSFLVAPAGSYKFSPASESVNTAYVFARKDLSRPALQLPGASKPVVAVRFCPVAFSLCGSTSGSGFFNLPYRLVFALATLNSLYIYDTESLNPIAILAGLHYAAVTDIAWSPDAKYLAVSSQDGYCTLVEFDPEELGSPVHLAAKGISVDDCRNQIPTEAQQMEVEPAGNSGCDVVDKKETHEKQEKQAPPVPVSTPAPTEAQQMEIESAGNSSCEVVDKKETHEKQEKQAPPVPVSTTAPDKPARRRITPMAIDP